MIGDPVIGDRKGANRSSGCRPPVTDRRYGAIAQLGERVLCKHEVVGSIPSGSTIWMADDGDRKGMIPAVRFDILSDAVLSVSSRAAGARRSKAGEADGNESVFRRPLSVVRYLTL